MKQILCISLAVLPFTGDGMGLQQDDLIKGSVLPAALILICLLLFKKFEIKN